MRRSRANEARFQRFGSVSGYTHRVDGDVTRILVTAFGTVPGANAHSSAILGMAAAIRGEMDLVTVKSPELSYQGRLGESRLFRVKLAGTPSEQRSGFARAVQRQLQAESYDLVHVRGPIEGSVVIPTHAEGDTRFIYEVGTFADEADGRQAQAEWLDAHERCLGAADLIIVGTRAAARHLTDRGFGGKVTVVPPGVDVDQYDWWTKADTEELRGLYLGAFTSDRELPVLLGATKQVAKRRPIHLMLAGERDPSGRAAMRRLVRDFGLEDVVEVRGEPKAVAIPSLIAGCDFGVVCASATPRFQEYGALPEPLLEYLACRRPVIAAGIPALAEVVRDEKEGLLYAPGDEESLADAILMLDGDDALVEKLVSAGYTRVREHFSSSARRRRMAAVYEMVMPGSQSFDAWSEAFDDPSTAEVRLPSGLIELESIAPSPSFARVDPSPRPHANPFESEDTGSVDTSPGTVSAEPLRGSPTSIDERPTDDAADGPPPFDTDPGRELV